MNPVSSGTITFVYLSGQTLTVADVREWLRRVEELGITDDHVLETASLRIRTVEQPKV